jgi:hypothetical protein
MSGGRPRRTRTGRGRRTPGATARQAWLSPRRGVVAPPLCQSVFENSCRLLLDPRSYETSRSMSVPSNALPRLRTLGVVEAVSEL